VTVVPLRGPHGDLASPADEALRVVTDLVLRLRLAPGSTVTEAELAASHGLSRSHVREALARLRREGLVESLPRAGYRIQPLTVGDARDLFGLRTLLEGEAAALAARRASDLEHLRELDRLSHVAFDPSSDASIAEFLTRNGEFHLAVSKVGGNARLHAALAHCIDHLRRFMHLGLAQGAGGEADTDGHLELLEAIRRQDADAARCLAVSHAQASHRMVLEALLSTDAVQGANLAGHGT
jgi:DNA-binding GntR family transcriptional regulator